MDVRRRIGILVPSTNTTAEPDFNMIAPAGVSIHAQRLWNPNEISPDSLDRMNSEAEQGAGYLATAEVEMVAYVCTGGSFFRGPEYDEDMVRRIEEASGVPAVATARAAADALRSLGANRISIVTPYPDWERAAMRTYYEALGFELLSLDGDESAYQAGARGICDPSPESVLDFAVAHCRPEAEALFCACTAWRSVEVVDELERRLSRPVVTANQATIWACFKKLGISGHRPGFGSLMESLSKAPV